MKQNFDLFVCSRSAVPNVATSTGRSSFQRSELEKAEQVLDGLTQDQRKVKNGGDSDSSDSSSSNNNNDDDNDNNNGSEPDSSRPTSNSEPGSGNDDDE